MERNFGIDNTAIIDSLIAQVNVMMWNEIDMELLYAVND